MSNRDTLTLYDEKSIQNQLCNKIENVDKKK